MTRTDRTRSASRADEGKVAPGLRPAFFYLRNDQGHGWNHKRVYGFHRELELNVRNKPRKPLKRKKPEAPTVPEAARMAIPSRRPFFPSRYGPEYINCTLMEWPEHKGVVLPHIPPGEPQRNACVERHNRTVRHEWPGLPHIREHRPGATDCHQVTAILHQPHGPDPEFRAERSSLHLVFPVSWSRFYFPDLRAHDTGSRPHRRVRPQVRPKSDRPWRKHPVAGHHCMHPTMANGTKCRVICHLPQK